MKTESIFRKAALPTPKIVHSNPGLRRREGLTGLLFLSPWLLGFILLKLLPILNTLWYSFTNFTLTDPGNTAYVGLENYIHFATDLNAWSSLVGSLGYFITTVPLELLVAMGLAAVLSSQRVRLKSVWRLVIFIPSIISAAAIYYVWKGFVNPSTGWLTRLVLTPLGLPPLIANGGVPFLTTIMALWSIGPGFLIMYGAMISVPKSLYEAARIDGAGPLMRFLNITVPMISPAIFFSLVINLTGAFGGSMLLDRGYVFSENLSSSPMLGYINQVMFTYEKMGYASALAWVMFAVTMTITIILFRSARRWVYFQNRADMKLFKRNKNLGESVLTLRLWHFTGSAILNLLIFILLAVYLSPLPYMIATTFKAPEQVAAGLVPPLYPAINKTYPYQGKDHLLVEVPTPDGLKQLALINAHVTYSEFIDPQHPEKGLIRWDGYWRSLKQVFVFRLNFDALKAWIPANLPQGMLNTFFVIVITEIGVLASSIAVAYGFSRFRIPGGKWLFYLLIATIMIPDSITLLPGYITWFNLLNIWIPHQSFLQFPFTIPWNWLPLIAPHLFSSAIFVFLLRQNFLSIPRDLDEAAMLDGAGPLRILAQIILPQSIPVVMTVAMLHFFYIWNEFRLSGLYLGTHYNFWLLAPRLQYGSPMPGVNPEPSTQSGALVLMIVPVIVLLAFQRFFLKDMVVTGTENNL